MIGLGHLIYDSICQNGSLYILDSRMPNRILSKLKVDSYPTGFWKTITLVTSDLKEWTRFQQKANRRFFRLAKAY